MYYEKNLKTQSEAEVRFLQDCITVGLDVEPQYPIEKIHVDFSIPERKLVIEIDSREYHGTEKALKNDTKRDEVYERNGWKVLRISASAVLGSGEEIAYKIKKGEYGSKSWERIIKL